jgi:UDP-glucose 4-epimerase
MAKRGIGTKLGRVAVFGGSGFLGSHVADVLTDRGFKVRIFDKKPSAYLRGDQEMVLGDILDAQKVLKAVQGCDWVYNFAGIADLDDATTKPLDTIRLNVIGNTHIMDAAVKAKAKRFLYASSIYVYSEKGGFYRCSKQASELYIEEYQRRYGLDFTILRYSSLYGTRATAANGIYRCLRQALDHGTVVCTGTSEQVRDFVHVKDAANLSADTLDPTYENKHVIISGQHPITFKAMVGMISEILGRRIRIRYGKVNVNHYRMTPYSFAPKIGYKLTNNLYLDMGQGLLECLNEMEHPRR